MSHEEDMVSESMQEFGALQQKRYVFNSHWDEVAELVLPTSRNTFNVGSFETPGQKKTDRQVDATASLALSRFSAILDSLLTPRNSFWHGLNADNRDLAKLRDVKLYFEEVTRTLFKERYKPTANFASQNLNTYVSLGAFGNGSVFIDRLRSPEGGRGLRYKSVPLGEVFLRENFQGMIDGFCRFFRLTKKQAYQQFGEENLPDQIKASTNENGIFDFLHRVYAKDNYDPERYDFQGMPYGSCYIALSGRKLISEGGYRTFPMPTTRYDQTPGEVYGRGPAMQVLPATKTLNAEKRDFLVQGHRAGTPVLLTTDDGMVDFSMRPGALNKGGWSTEGKPLVGALPAGNIQVTKEMMDEERSLINDAFLVTLFQILTEAPQMTATEVIERTNEKGILLAPTVGRQQSEYLGPMIERELSVLAGEGLLPPMPPVLKEAAGEYSVVYTSPLAKAMRAQEVAGFSRTMEMITGIVNITQDPEPLDNFDFDIISREVSEIQAVPESWMADPKLVEMKRQKRAEMQKAQMEIQAAPAAAAMMKAQAVQEKSGVKQGK
jgi:hypothetical protein